MKLVLVLILETGNDYTVHTHTHTILVEGSNHNIEYFALKCSRISPNEFLLNIWLMLRFKLINDFFFFSATTRSETCSNRWYTVEYKNRIEIIMCTCFAQN